MYECPSEADTAGYPPNSQALLFACPHILSDQASGHYLLRGESSEKQKYTPGAAKSHFGVFDNVIQQLNY